MAGPPPTTLYATPTTLNLGTAVVGSPLAGNFTLVALYGGPINWGPITTNDVDFVVGAPLSGSLAAGTATTKSVTVTKLLPGTFNALITVTWSGGGGSGVAQIHVTATFVAAGGVLNANPGSVAFTTNVIGAADQDVVITVSNNTGGMVTLTGADVTGLPFSTPSAFPVNVPNGGSVPITARVSYNVVGVFTGTLTLHNPVSDLVIPLSVTIFYLFSVNPLQNSSRATLMGFINAGVGMPKKFDGSNFNSELAQVLIFNGTLWNNPGNEKVLRRVQVFYENVGVCTGLKLDVKCWRPTLTPAPGQFDTVSDTITIGNTNADSEEMSAFFDVELTGDLIVMQLSRLANSGPVSILGFIPHFEDKGEKVEGV